MTFHLPRLATLATLTLLLSSPALAHEFWIELSKPTPAVGEIAHVSLQIGEPFRGQPVRRDARVIRDFVHVGSGASTPVVGRDGGHPAGMIRAETAGTSIIAYRSQPFVIEHTADRFNHYLAEDGLDEIARMRAAAGATDEPTREIYFRYAKRLVRTPDGPTTGFDRVLGHTLEIVPDRDPLASPGPIPFRLLFHDEPLANVKMIAINATDPDTVREARTDEAGRVTFDLDQDGGWIVAAVHMVAAGDDDTNDAEWKSAWASLSFARTAATTLAGTP